MARSPWLHGKDSARTSGEVELRELSATFNLRVDLNPLNKKAKSDDRFSNPLK